MIPVDDFSILIFLACEDENKDCKAWADKGFCDESHTAYVKLHCKFSCDLCGGELFN